MNRVLLTVYGALAPDLGEQVAGDRRPRPDYLVMAEALGADLLDPVAARRATGRTGRVVERVLGNSALLAWACFRLRSRYDVVFTDGENVGFIYAALTRLARRRPTHAMITHIVSVPKKVLMFRALGLGRRIDRMFVYASAQRRFVVEDLGYPADKTVLTPFMVDTRFFRPPIGAGSGQPGRPPLISSAGLEFRDYPTLVEAVRGLGVRVTIAAASPWSKRADSSQGVDLPDNVEITRLAPDALRVLYERSDLVVVPVVETDFQAGITTILEAMAMAKPLVCTRTTGQTDTVVDGENGLYVPPGDPGALRIAIQTLLADPDLGARLGAAARCWAVEHAEVEVYARRLAAHVAGAAAERRRDT